VFCCRYPRKKRGSAKEQHASGTFQIANTASDGRTISNSHDGVPSNMDSYPVNGTDGGISPQRMDTATALEMPYAEEEGPSAKSTIDAHNLSYTIEVDYRPKGGSTEPLRVHYPIPASITNRTELNPENLVREPVSLHEALNMPSQDIADRLVHIFFTVIHPAYPVFDRKTFGALYSRGQASPLLLHTIFLLGFTVGTESLVQEAGYSDRATARRIHYLRAKALYDADYDNDRSNIVACLLLMGFWWSGPEDQKDTCYWVGCATNVAQSMGMHRSYVELANCLVENISHTALGHQIQE